MSVTDLLCEKSDRAIPFEKYPKTWSGVLRCYMDFYGINQHRICQRARLSDTVIRPIIAGKNIPTLAVASKISTAIGIDLEDWVRHVPKENRGGK